MWMIAPELIRRLPDKTVTAEMETPDNLTEVLLRGDYQIVILDAQLYHQFDAVASQGSAARSG